MNISIDKLQELCELYDKENGMYPETQYQGLDVFETICDYLNITPKCEKCDSGHIPDWADQDRYAMKNLYMKDGWKYEWRCYRCEEEEKKI